MKNPDPPSDRDIQDAFRALDGTLRDGQLDDFSSRVLARLDEPEVGSMDARELARGSGVSRPDEAALGAVPEPTRDENSGLHEIKALASTTRRRISQKITSEKEGEDSLLVGASSGSFRAAALPDPAREKAAPQGRAVEAHPVVVRPASEADRRSMPSRSSSAPFWVLGGVAFAAAAAAVAVFVFGVGRANESDKAPASDVIARADTPAPTEQGAATSAPDGNLKFAEPPPPPAAEPAAAAPAEVAPGAVDEDTTVARGDAEGGVLAGRAGASAGGGKNDEHHADPAKGSREEKKEAEKEERKPARKIDGKDLGDVLDQVTGKVEDKPAQADGQEAQKKPTKKELDRSDVAKAMGPVRASVMRCRDKEQFEGTVTVKFQVAPSGQVTSAEATGSKAGSPTGACVAAAVKKAKFPPFDGAPTSFTYPFLLAE